jgi:hypothetical protein
MDLQTILHLLKGGPSPSFGNATSGPKYMPLGVGPNFGQATPQQYQQIHSGAKPSPSIGPNYGNPFRPIDPNDLTYPKQ